MLFAAVVAFTPAFSGFTQIIGPQQRTYVQQRAYAPVAMAKLEQRADDISSWDTIDVPKNDRLDRYIASLKAAKQFDAAADGVTVTEADLQAAPVVMGAAPSGFSWAPEVKWESAAAALVAAEMSNVRRAAEREAESALLAARDTAKRAVEAAKTADAQAAAATRAANEASAAAVNEATAAKAAEVEALALAVEATAKAEAAEAKADAADAELTVSRGLLAAARKRAAIVATTPAVVPAAVPAAVVLAEALEDAETLPALVASKESAEEVRKSMRQLTMRIDELEASNNELKASNAALDSELKQVKMSAAWDAAGAKQTLAQTVLEFEEALERERASKVEAVREVRGELEGQMDEQRRQAAKLEARINELMGSVAGKVVPSAPTSPVPTPLPRAEAGDEAAAEAPKAVEAEAPELTRLELLDRAYERAKRVD